MRIPMPSLMSCAHEICGRGIQEISGLPSAPVTGLPRALNNEAMRVGLRFVADARARHQRFLAIAWGPSYPTMAWLTQISSDDFEVNDLAELDSVVVLEFKPRYN